MTTIDKYTNLITNEHIDKPRFFSTVEISCQDYVHIQNVVLQFINDFDLDLAVGVQLDAIGIWVGISRVIISPILGVYFTWRGTVAEGWRNGIWRGVGDPENFTTILTDEEYRRLLQSKILSNNWDGTKEQAYDILDAFVTPVIPILISDNQNMSITVTIDEASVTATELAVIVNGYIQIQPAGVRMIYEVV